MRLMNPSTWRVARRALLFVAVAVTIVHARRYSSFIEDDALISLRYAERLLQGKGLTWTDGQPVEGYSNLLWVLLVALPGYFGADLIVSATLWGCFFMCAASIVLLARYLPERVESACVPAGMMALVCFAGAGPVAVWSIGGLEQPLVAAALAGALALYFGIVDEERPCLGRVVGLSALLGVLCLARPDGPLFTVAMAAAWVVGRWTSGQRGIFRVLVMMCCVPVLAVLGQLLFRVTYYGEWVPNTALVKLGPTAHHVANGFRYAGAGLAGLLPLSLVATVLLGWGVARCETRARFLPLLFIAVLWLSYVVYIGGDYCPAYRHLVPIIVVFAWTLGEGIAVLYRRHPERRTTLCVSAAVLAVLFLVVQFAYPPYRAVLKNRWVWHGRSLALTLKSAFASQRPLMAVTAAGCLPYWSGFACLDMLGLNDHYLPRHKPSDMGDGLLGHELGDGAYVLRSEPDIMVFSVGAEPAFRAGRQLTTMPEFHEQYARVLVRTAESPVYTARAWFRRESDRIGIRRESDRVVVPGFLFNAGRDSVAVLDGDRLAVLVDAEHPAAIDLRGTEGAWTCTVVGDRAAEVACSMGVTDGVMRIELTTTSAAALAVREVVLTRAQPGGH